MTLQITTTESQIIATIQTGLNNISDESVRRQAEIAVVETVHSYGYGHDFDLDNSGTLEVRLHCYNSRPETLLNTCTQVFSWLVADINTTVSQCPTSALEGHN